MYHRRFHSGCCNYPLLGSCRMYSIFAFTKGEAQVGLVRFPGQHGSFTKNNSQFVKQLLYASSSTCGWIGIIHSRMGSVSAILWKFMEVYDLLRVSFIDSFFIIPIKPDPLVHCVQVCNYPFTTRGILMGHIILNHQTFQVS